MWWIVSIDFVRTLVSLSDSPSSRPPVVKYDELCQGWCFWRGDHRSCKQWRRVVSGVSRVTEVTLHSVALRHFLPLIQSKGRIYGLTRNPTTLRSGLQRNTSKVFGTTSATTDTVSRLFIFYVRVCRHRPAWGVCHHVRVKFILFNKIRTTASLHAMNDKFNKLCRVCYKAKNYKISILQILLRYAKGVLIKNNLPFHDYLHCFAACIHRWAPGRSGTLPINFENHFWQRPAIKHGIN